MIDFQKHYFLTMTGIQFYFTKNNKDFVVEEIPLYPFSGEGEHIGIVIRKKGLSTWEALQKISEVTGCKIRDIGYAGLKDKEGMTIQHLTLPRQFETFLHRFEESDIKILSATRHNNKLKIGHLKGNRFFIRLKKVLPVGAVKIQEGLKQLALEGMPNYFGYQRFGKDGDNALKGQEIVEGKRKFRDKKLAKLMINAYQSALFNSWLAKRMEMSKVIQTFTPQEASQLLNLPLESVKLIKQQPHFFRILDGDVLCHYPFGRAFLCEDTIQESQRFKERHISVTGLLAGEKTLRSTGMAGEIERHYDFACGEFGDRRFAWVYPENITSEYKEENAWFEMGFYLPKSCYATTLLEELAGGDVPLTQQEEK